MTATPNDGRRDVGEAYAALQRLFDAAKPLVANRRSGKDAMLQDVQTITRALATVSAATPDEREAERLPFAPEQRWALWNEWAAAHPDDDTSEYDAFLGGMTAALAARPAPVVSGEAVLAALDATGLGADVSVQGGARFLTALGITVADAPAAEDCARCDGSGEEPDPDPHDERFYRCTRCGGTGVLYLPDVDGWHPEPCDEATDDEGCPPGCPETIPHWHHHGYAMPTAADDEGGRE